ncbi:MAG: glycoside hydrolase family 78 protein [Muribaculaceae bacterium]|jgi:alpha-L-rhamnosidase|nr:glycoside hydrolase family 78 protein [Muribaculaceae bacterium]
MKKTAIFTIFMLLALCIPIKASELTGVKTTRDESPQGICFSWQIKSDKADVMQKSYSIEVASSPADLKSGKNLLWKSGEVKSDNSVLIEYAGKPLASASHYFWKVLVKTNKGEKLKGGGDWLTGLLNESDWKASWIGLNDTVNAKADSLGRTTLPARYLRKVFSLNGAVKRATLFVSGVGNSMCYINGAQVSDDVFGPLPTLYTKSVNYLIYDVTSMLHAGENAIGVLLGNGRYFDVRKPGTLMFGLPRLRAQLEVELADGKVMVLSDGSWQATNRGPIVENNEYDGEKYDARLELGDWTVPSYDASAWQKAVVMPAPGGVMTAQSSPCLKVMDSVKPVSITPTGDGRYILDMGQNMVGWLVVKLNGKAGKPIQLRFSETLQPGGKQLYVANFRTALSANVYIPKSDAPFTWHPALVYHGFRFVEISGLDYEPTVNDFEGKVVYDDMATLGSFSTSNNIVNSIYKNAYWGIRGNYRGMPTDCPQRDERMGWLGDRATGAKGESFVLDNHTMYHKWMRDIEESMMPNGCISDVSPHYWDIYNDDVTWPSAYFYITDMLYTQFGDSRAIKERYASMKHWVMHNINDKMKDGLCPNDTYGDWCMPPETPKLIHSEDPARQTNGTILSSSVFYNILQLMQKFAAISGANQDIKYYADVAANLKEAYNKKFFNLSIGGYDNNTVTANMLSLRLGLVPTGYESKVFDNIIKKTEIDCNGHVSAGVLGIQHLMRGLTERGKVDLAYKIVTNDTYPSWGYMAKNGATTIWELWNGNTADPAMNSGNHVMLLGDLVIWFYEDLAGIKNDPASVGFKKIWMEPNFPEGLSNVDASYQSPYGKISSKWSRTGDNLDWNIEIPANTTATVKLPKRFGINPVAGRNGIRSVAQQGDFVLISLGSGSYSLKSK